MFAFANCASVHARTVFFSASSSLSPRTIPHFHRHFQPTPAALQSTTVVAQAAGKKSTKRRMPAVLRPVVPSSELLQFNVEDKAQPRAEILRRVNSYVKENNLQDPSNRRIILCNNKLKTLLGVDTCTHFEINGFISPYIRKPEDIGGRYVDEAKLVEQLYLEQKEIEEANKPKDDKKLTKKKPAKARTFKPVMLSNDLAVICRTTEMSRPDVLKAVWAYIRLNNLQSEPGQPIKCDFLLKKVFNLDEVNAKIIMKGISPHLSKKE